jgi:putative transposase
MKSLKNTISKTLRGKGVRSPHWQKGFFDHVLRSPESYAQKWTYVQQNPVRAGLASQPDDWPFQGENFPL